MATAEASKKRFLCRECGFIGDYGVPKACPTCGATPGGARNINPELQQFKRFAIGVVVMGVVLALITVVSLLGRAAVWNDGARSIWRNLMLASGFGLICVAYYRAWQTVKRVDEKVRGIFDAPGAVVSYVIRETCLTPICLTVWGLAIVVCGGLMFGIDYESIARTNAKARTKLHSVVAAAQNMNRAVGGLFSKSIADQPRITAADLESAIPTVVLTPEVDTFAMPEEVSAPAFPFPDITDKDQLQALGKREIECVVMGYTRDRRGAVKSVLVVSDVLGKPQYVGQIGSRYINPAALESIRTRIPLVDFERPIVPCELEANWVKPDIVCSVRHSGWTTEQTVTRPWLIEITDFMLPGME